MNAHIDTFPKKNAFNEINFKLALNFISKNDVSLDFERLQLGEVWGGVRREGEALVQTSRVLFVHAIPDRATYLDGLQSLSPRYRGSVYVWRGR